MKRRCWLAVSFLLFGVLFSAVRCGEDPAIERYNLILGTQTFGIRYGFTRKTRLVETAEVIRDVGSHTIKFACGRVAEQQYGLPPFRGIHSLRDLARREPSVRYVLSMPFTYYVLWAYCFGSVNWRDGLSGSEKERLYGEFKDFASHLLREYSGTGKTFLLGHWEGDWSLLGSFNAKANPSQQAVEGMIQWLSVRQRAVEDARRLTPHHGVRVFHYTEVNLVWKALTGGKCVTNDVLPSVAVDYVSYSAWDSLRGTPEEMEGRLKKAFTYIASKLKPKGGDFLPGRRVFVGEYGMALSRAGTPRRQDFLSRHAARVALLWGCPFVLYWEIYCNEISEGRHRGFWMINDRGEKQPIYRTHKAFFSKAHSYLASFKERRNRLPSPEEFRREAAQWLLPGPPK